MLIYTHRKSVISHTTFSLPEFILYVDREESVTLLALRYISFNENSRKSSIRFTLTEAVSISILKPLASSPAGFFKGDFETACFRVNHCLEIPVSLCCKLWPDIDLFQVIGLDTRGMSPGHCSNHYFNDFEQVFKLV